MSDEKVSTQQKRLGAELNYLRRLARVGGREMAAATGLSQSSVSRIESGKRRPSAEEVETWIATTGAGGVAVARIRELLKGVHAETMRWHELLTDTGSLQEHVAARERAARTIRVWAPDEVPGLIQTRAYAEALLPLVLADGADPAKSLDGRMERQRLLYEPGRRFHFLTTEHALSRAVASPEVMAEQAEHAVRAGTLDGVTVGIVPEPWPLVVANAFTLYDDLDDGHPFVTLERVDGYITNSEPPFVAVYRQAFDRLVALAR